MPDYPAAHLLVSSDVPMLSDDLTIVHSTVLNGLPHFVDLTNQLVLKVTLPSGLMRAWLDADPSALVCSSDDERQPRPGTLEEPVGAVTRSALRVTVVQGATTLSVAPAALGVRHSLTAAGEQVRGVAVDVALVGWAIFAGSVQGPGDFGSFVHLGWKAADEAVNELSPPPINPFLKARLDAGLTMRSDLGVLSPNVSRRSALRRLTRNVLD
jgi:hypothetical protein